MTFMSYGREHHDIALQALPKGAKHVRGNGVAKLHHFCFYVDKNEIIDQLYPILKRRKIPGGQRSGDSGGGGQPLGKLSRSGRQPRRNRLQRQQIQVRPSQEASASAPRPKKMRELAAKNAKFTKRNRTYRVGIETRYKICLEVNHVD